MSEYNCPNCGGDMNGDGYTVVLHCENSDANISDCEPDSDPVYCEMRKHDIEMVCDGHLASCKVCHGGEGSLTTECCGRPITEEETRRVYEVGDLDFVDGKWKEICKVCRGKGHTPEKVKWTGDNWTEVYYFIVHMVTYQSHNLDPDNTLHLTFTDNTAADLAVGDILHGDIICCNCKPQVGATPPPNIEVFCEKCKKSYTTGEDMEGFNCPHCVESNGVVKAVELAKFMHEVYEEKSVECGWQTQEQCQVEFDKLPEQNRFVMIAVAEAVFEATCEKLQNEYTELATMMDQCKESLFREMAKQRELQGQLKNTQQGARNSIYNLLAHVTGNKFGLCSPLGKEDIIPEWFDKLEEEAKQLKSNQCRKLKWRDGQGCVSREAYEGHTAELKDEIAELKKRHEHLMDVEEDSIKREGIITLHNISNGTVVLSCYGKTYEFKPDERKSMDPSETILHCSKVAGFRDADDISAFRSS